MNIAICPVGAASAGSGADAPTDDVCLDDTCASMRRQSEPTIAAQQSAGPAGSGGDPVIDDVTFDDGLSLIQKKLGLMTSTNHAVRVTPVQKVLTLLHGMVAKGKKEKQEEEVQFAEYKEFCESSKKKTENSVTKGSAKIDELKTRLGFVAASEISKQIEELENEMGAKQADMKQAEAERQAESADFEQEHAELVESIEAIEKATEILKAKEMPSSSLLEILQRSSHIPDAAREAIIRYFTQDPLSTLQKVAPEASAFEAQAAGVAEMVSNLGIKFKDQLKEHEKEEMGKKFEYDRIVLDQRQELTEKQKKVTELRAMQSDLSEKESKLQDELDENVKALAENVKYLADLQKTCNAKTEAFENRQMIRFGEIQAVEKGIEILSSGAVAPDLTKETEALEQAAAQLRSFAQKPNLLEVAAFLDDQAQRTNAIEINTGAVQK